ncbi:MAG TPA: hypothetical protein VFY16_14130, partial [Gemmatimonadaceae bacterium]|nr:hypothetical protein [Gemmatimonadaceae bacterium]
MKATHALALALAAAVPACATSRPATPSVSGTSALAPRLGTRPPSDSTRAPLPGTPPRVEIVSRTEVAHEIS